MRIFKPGENELQPARVAIYGDPKAGKTRLATSLPWGEYWGERAVYVAWDPGAADLRPVLPVNRKHLLTVVPQSLTGAFDPLESAVEIASYDWVKQEGCKTLIWDTMTYTSTDILAAVAPLGLYGKNIALGKKGEASFIAQPTIGDYGAVQRSIMHILQFLFDQHDLNVIVLFHSVMTDAESGAAETVGGPATVGKANIRPISGLFDNLFRVAMKRVRIGTGLPALWEKKRVVQTESADNWLAGMRSGHAANPIPEFPLTESVTDFWKAVEDAGKGTA